MHFPTTPRSTIIDWPWPLCLRYPKVFLLTQNIRPNGTRTTSNLFPFHTGSDSRDLLPLRHIRFLVALSTDRPTPDSPSAPLHNGSISRDSVPLRRVRMHDTRPGGRSGPFPYHTTFHNGSVSGDSVPVRQDHLSAAISTGRSTPDSAGVSVRTISRMTD